MENEVKNKKMVLSDDELQQVVGGTSSRRNSDRSIFMTKNECSTKSYGVWDSNACRLKEEEDENTSNPSTRLLVPVIS